MLSVWEEQSFYSAQQYTIIGSGFMGLWTAYKLSEKYPGAKILVIERGVIPNGASTKNAGFVCFGSLTELMEDAELYGIDSMLETTAKRYAGIQQIKTFSINNAIDFQLSGGYELIDSDPFFINEDIREAISRMNQILQETIGPDCFELSDDKKNRFGFESFTHLVYNKREGTVHPGRLVQALIKICSSRGVSFLYNTEVEEINESQDGVSLFLNNDISIETEKLFICTNAFSKKFLPDTELYPARGQVIFTRLSSPLKFKGSFHYNRGFYYFRDLDGGIILGGARNLAIAEETTTEPGITALIQNDLEKFLNRLVPGNNTIILKRWSGIMAMGNNKTPVVKKISKRIFAGIRLSGIGVAIAPVLADELLEMENPGHNSRG